MVGKDSSFAPRPQTALWGRKFLAVHPCFPPWSARETRRVVHRAMQSHSWVRLITSLILTCSPLPRKMTPPLLVAALLATLLPLCAAQTCEAFAGTCTYGTFEMLLIST